MRGAIEVSQRDLEPTQGEPTQTNRGYYSLLEAIGVKALINQQPAYAFSNSEIVKHTKHHACTM